MVLEMKINIFWKVKLINQIWNKFENKISIKTKTLKNHDNFPYILPHIAFSFM